MKWVDEHAEQILLGPAELAEALAAHERRAAVLALAVAHVHDTGDWAADGSVTMRAWIRDRCRMSDRDAAGWIRRANLLDHYPVIADAAVNGVLSSSQLAELERLDRPKYAALLREHQQLLVGELAHLDAEATHHACALWRQRADALLDDGAPPLEPRRELNQTRADDGALLGRFVLDDAAATEWETAVTNALTHQGAEEVRTFAERQGDAMFDIAAFYNKNHDRDGSPRHHPHVGISVDASTLDDHPEGVNDHNRRPVTPSCTDSYLCDCTVHTILRDTHGAPLAFGRSRYVVPRRLFRQVAARDGGCRFPGCNRTVRHCDAHHIRHWRHHGSTDYENLVFALRTSPSPRPSPAAATEAAARRGAARHLGQRQRAHQRTSRRPTTETEPQPLVIRGRAAGYGGRDVSRSQPASNERSARWTRSRPTS